MMETEPRPNQESFWTREEELPGSRKFWIVDDEEEMLTSLERYFGARKPDGATFRTFSRASDCLEAIKALLNRHSQDEYSEVLPSVIFLDRNLDQDSGELRKGEAVVEKLRELFEAFSLPRPPLLVAHSSQEENNRKMVQEGAEAQIRKGDFSAYETFWEQVRNYFAET